MPLSTWGWFITSCMGLTAFAVLMPACILLILDHVAGTSFFVPSNLVVNDQWSRTLEVRLYSLATPVLVLRTPRGVHRDHTWNGHCLACLIANMRRPMLSHRVLIYSMGALAVLSYMVYGHHMFVSGMNPVSSLAFSFPTLIITIPSTIIVLIWLGSLYGAKLRINTASLFALGFISMFISGRGEWLLLSPTVSRYHAARDLLRRRALPYGHGCGCDVRGIFAGTHFWFPKMFGRMMNETLGKLHFSADFRRHLLYILCRFTT